MKNVMYVHMSFVRSLIRLGKSKIFSDTLIILPLLIYLLCLSHCMFNFSRSERLKGLDEM